MLIHEKPCLIPILYIHSSGKNDFLPKLFFCCFAMKTLVVLKAQEVRKLFIQMGLLSLTLKMPRKTASENVVCLCRLLNILANFSNLLLHTPANSVDPDQTAPRGAV